MQLVKGLFIAAVLCMASVSAGNAHQQQEQEQKSRTATSTTSTAAREKGEESSTNYTLLYVSLGACACIGVLGAVYLKRRKDDDKLPGEIFTIDDKNSVLDVTGMMRRWQRTELVGYYCSTTVVVDLDSFNMGYLTRSNERQ
ncbi:hypothetical protein GQ600_20574 [Phytophthora cactorum]|nr:hypothetical protein GQ600_20574 [Phytophthora cactorum]